MKPPRFWSNPAHAPGLAARLLAPAGALYARAVARRIEKTSPVDPGVPVICIGNATLGGVGKTPFARLLMERLKARGIAGAFLSRGYGGSEKGPLRVDPHRHGAADVGDEPLMLSADAPAYIARDRAAGARAAVADGAQAILLDDGHQNPTLAKRLTFLLVDAETGFGNGCVFPAGPLREPADVSAARADALVLVKSSRDSAIRNDLAEFAPELPRLSAWLEPENAEPARVLAFCGIGRPEKFFETLRAAGFDVAETAAFGDHEPYVEADLERLRARAQELGARLITTEKDAARLGSAGADIDVLKARMKVDDAALLDTLLARAFDGTPSAR